MPKMGGALRPASNAQIAGEVLRCSYGAAVSTWSVVLWDGVPGMTEFC